MKKILIIDEQPFSRIMLKDALDENYHVLEAENATEAIGIAQRNHVELILLNLEMTDRGSAVCAELKEANETKYIPLILLSSYEQKEEIIDGLHAGAEDYMTKPINANELLTRIETHIRTRKYYSDFGKNDLLILLELTEVISVTRNPRKILITIVEKMVEAIEVSRCSIIVINDSGEIVVKASSDLPKDQEVKLDLGKYPEIEKALKTQRPVVIQDIQNDPLMKGVKDKIKGLSDKSILVVPIIKKQSVIGTFFLRTASPLKGGITDRIFKLCQVVANISGNALENAVLFESMQSHKKLLEEIAVQDSLTKLYNHQQFHARLEEEFSRAKRYSLPLSCLFADIDDFKTINDRYGHIAGDVVLKQIAILIKQVLRKSDLAARYGGEEFAVLLPNTESEGALEFANRFQELIRELSIQQLRDKKITVSIGISTYSNENLESYKDLLQLADESMYEAKMAGKDRICQAKISS